MIEKHLRWGEGPIYARTMMEVSLKRAVVESMVEQHSVLHLSNKRPGRGGGASDMRERIKRQGGLFMSISSRCVLSPMQPVT